MVITGEKGVIIANHWNSGYGKKDKEEIVVLHRDERVETLTFEPAKGGHNGGDDKLIRMLFAGDVDDPLNQFADSFAGITSAMIGIAANESIETGKTVDVQKYLNTLR